MIVVREEFQPGASSPSDTESRMQVQTKLLSRSKSFTDKKCDSSQDSTATALTARAQLARFRLRIRTLTNLVRSRSLKHQQPTAAYENTYRTEPEGSRRFSAERAEQVIEEVFENYLRGKAYEPKDFSGLIKTLAALIRDRVKMQDLDRYKILATVTVIQNKRQGIQLSSRAIWNQNLDNYASLTFEGPNYYAVGSVYAVYYE